MKSFSLFYILLILSLNIHAQSVDGAWQATYTNDAGVPVKAVVIFADGYQSMAEFHAETGAFISTNGGTWTLERNQANETVEFHTSEPEKVGTSVSFEIEVNGNSMSVVGSDITWTRIDDGTPGALNGAWLMSGRKRNGEITTRDTSRPRKTMKILSGTRFQWIAYNTETKSFMGTGGGTYTTIDGKYTENIEFFSRDDARVGANLEFDYELIDGNWHHSGFSSKGDPLYEIWSIRK